MDEQGTNPSDKPSEQSTELRPLTHNGFFTNTFQRVRLAKGFLRVVLPSKLRECLDLDGLTIEPKHLTDNVFKNREADIIYRVPIRETEHYIDFFVILEHKSFNDLWTIFQLWVYVALICQRDYRKAEEAWKGHVPADYRLPPVIAVILHHGKSRFTGKTELSELFVQIPGIDEYLPKLQAVLFDLNTIEDDEMPEDPEVPELKLVLAALKLVFRKDVSTKITEIIEELKPLTNDPVIHDFICTVWCYLVSNAEHMRQDYNILLDTVKSVVGVEAMPTMLEIWTAEAVEKKTAETGRNMVLAVLRARFKNIPKRVEDAIGQMNDPIALESRAADAATCQSLDEFAQFFD